MKGSQHQETPLLSAGALTIQKRTSKNFASAPHTTEDKQDNHHMSCSRVCFFSCVSTSPAPDYFETGPEDFLETSTPTHARPPCRSAEERARTFFREQLLLLALSLLDVPRGTPC